jgi:hypothetical protein
VGMKVCARAYLRAMLLLRTGDNVCKSRGAVGRRRKGVTAGPIRGRNDRKELVEDGYTQRPASRREHGGEVVTITHATVIGF